MPTATHEGPSGPVWENQPFQSVSLKPFRFRHHCLKLAGSEMPELIITMSGSHVGASGSITGTVPPGAPQGSRELQRKAINIQDSSTGQLTDTRESKRQQVKLQMFSLCMWTSHKCLSVCLLWCVTVFKIQRQAETNMRHWKRKINPNKLRKWSPEGYYFG